eukprot:scaffold17717_cov112-Isochrysis_galbana.AAC.2
MDALAEPIGRSDSHLAVYLHLVGGGKTIRPLGQVLHSARVVVLRGAGGRGSEVGTIRLLLRQSSGGGRDVPSLLVHRGRRYGGRHRKHSALPQLLLAIRLARGRSCGVLTPAGQQRCGDCSFLRVVSLARFRHDPPLGLYVQAADHRLLCSAEPGNTKGVGG